MIRQTTQQHEGMPVLQIAGCVPLSTRLTPAFVSGVQIGFLREQCTTSPRTRVELEQHRHGYFLEANRIRWTGD